MDGHPDCGCVEASEAAWEHALTARKLARELQLPRWEAKVGELLECLHRSWDAAAPAAAPPAGGLIRKAQDVGDGEIIAVSEAMLAALRQCDTYAAYDDPVLVTGETGTGKELVARRLHAGSPRRDKPFVVVNCGAIPASLFEREFFGHRKGAYTGAEERGLGFVAAAEGGTLFLDEVGELPLEVQPKLLRLLQDGSYFNLGDPKLRTSNLRVIAATNASLRTLSETGRFRPDLYFRLRMLEISLVPLRERVADIAPLLTYFLTRFAGRRIAAGSFFTPGSLAALKKYRWPGNVREVKMIARRAQICAEAEGAVRIRLGDEQEGAWLSGPDESGIGAAGTEKDLAAPRARVESLLIETGGNKAETARRLGISRTTLYRWMREDSR